MSKRTLSEHRPWLLASLAASIAFFAISKNWILAEPLPELYLAVLKGAGVGFLAVYAWVRHPEADAKVIALVLALGALGDAVLELFFEVGAGVFLAGHVAATIFYLRHPRAAYAARQIAVAVALSVATPLVSWLLTGDLLVTLYSCGLGAMAASAWASRFPRYRVGLGAMLFVVSDWLIFARMGITETAPVADWLVWPIYYSGQFLIATGVIQTLRSDAASGR